MSRFTQMNSVDIILSGISLLHRRMEIDELRAVLCGELLYRRIERNDKLFHAEAGEKVFAQRTFPVARHQRHIRISGGGDDEFRG